MTVGLVTVSSGCGGYSEQKATQVCEQERTAKGQCVVDGSFAQCVDCYMECGSKCRAQATCPETYACLDDDGGEGGGSSTGTEN